MPKNGEVKCQGQKCGNKFPVNKEGHDIRCSRKKLEIGHIEIKCDPKCPAFQSNNHHGNHKKGILAMCDGEHLKIHCDCGETSSFRVHLPKQTIN
jgi:hypothetical protein